MGDALPPVVAAPADGGVAPPDAGGDVLSESLPADRVPIVGQDGKLVSVPQENYEAAIAEGYRFQTPEEQQRYSQELKYGDSPVQAFAAGAARGVTLGLSDAALPAIGLVKKSTLKGLQEANVGASVAGDVAGTAASLLIPGAQEVSGPGLVAKLGRTVEAGLALKGAGLGERLLAKAVAGGVEGSLYGAGHAVSEAYLGDAPLNAQKLIAGAGLGTILGAAGGGLGGLMEEGALATGRAAAKAYKKANLGELLGDKADDFGAKALGGIQSNFKGLERDEVRAIARDVRETLGDKWGKLDNAADLLPKVQAARKETGELIGRTLKEADAAGVKTFDFAPARQRLDDFFQKLNPAEQDMIESQLRQTMSQLERAGAKPGAGFSAANELKSTLQGGINYKTDVKTKTNLLKKAVGIFRDEIDTQLKGAVPDEALAKFIKAKDIFGSLSEAEKWGKRGAAALDGNRKFSLTDYISGAGLGSIAGGPAGLAAGMAGAVGNKLLRERGPSFASHALEAIAEHPALATVSKSFATALQQTNPQLLGSYGPALMNAAAKGPAQALLTHVRFAQTDPAYREQMALAGFVQEDSAKHAQTLENAGHLAVVKDALQARDDDLGKMIDRALKGGAAPRSSAGVLSSQDFGNKRQRKDSPEAFKTRAEEIIALASNPQALMERTSANVSALAKGAPATAAAMTATANTALQFLATKLQRPPPAGPLAPEWKPSPTEIARFNRYLEAVQEPLVVLRHAAAGTVSQEGIEALKAVYPELHQELQRAVVQRLTDKPKSVPYSQRVMLGLATGVDVDGTLNPVTIQRAQQTYIAPSAKNQEDQLQQQPGPSRADKLSVAKRSATPIQAAANRED